MNATLSVDLPPGLDPDEARTLLAAALFDRGRLSLGQAAEMVGLPKAAFLEILGALGVSPFQYDGDDLADEFGRPAGGG